MPVNKEKSLVPAAPVSLKAKKKQAPPPPPPDPHHKPGKKHAKKHDGPEKHPKDHEDAGKASGKHLRRAFEHLGRVEILLSLKEVRNLPAVNDLVHLAQAALHRGYAHTAADLLRAAEHLSFAASASKSTSALNPDLEHAVRREFRKLLEHAEEHDLPKATALGKLLRDTLDGARSAFAENNFGEALELARAAEALASLDPDETRTLSTNPALKA